MRLLPGLLWIYSCVALAGGADPHAALEHAEKARQLTVAAQYSAAIAEWREALRLQPGNPLFHNLYGLALQQSGQPIAARNEFRNALRLKLDFADAQSNLAYSLWEGHDYDQAAIELDRALQLSPNDEALHLLRGRMFARAANPASACREFGRASPWPHDDATLWEVLESCLFAGDSQMFLAAANKLPDNPQMQLTIGTWLLENRRAVEAIAFIQKASGDPGLHAKATILLAEAKLASCSPESALELLNHLDVPPKLEYQSHDLRGSALLALGRASEAENEFRTLVNRFPDLPEAYIAATQVPLQQSRWDDALKILNDGLKRMPGQWFLLFRRGMVHKLSGHTDKAKTDLVAALEAGGDVSLVAAALGDLEAETGNLASAAELFQRTWSQTRLPQFRLAYALALIRMGDSAKALSELRELAATSPRDPQVHYTLGKLLARGGSGRDAEAEFERVRQLDPGLAVNLYALGHLYLSLGQTEKAKAVMAEFQKSKREIAPAPCHPQR